MSPAFPEEHSAPAHSTCILFVYPPVNVRRSATDIHDNTFVLRYRLQAAYLPVSLSFRDYRISLQNAVGTVQVASGTRSEHTTRVPCPDVEHLPGPASRDDRKHYDSLPPRHRPTASARASLLLLCFRNIPSLRCSRSRAGIAPGNAFSVRGKIAIFVLPSTKFQRLCYLPIYISISFARRNS